MHSLEQHQYSYNFPASTSLRPYQKKFVADVYSQIRAGAKRILGFAPTGAGKTVIAAQIVRDAISKKRRLLFVVHRDILISQTYDKLKSIGITNCGFIKSGWQEDRESAIQLASVQTLVKRDWWQEFSADLVILDEAHIVAYNAVIQRMMIQTYPQALYLAFTATPWRLSKHENMGDIFPSLVCAPMPFELINQGYLVKPSYFSLNQVDLAKIGTVAGDFDESQLALACDRPELIQHIVQDWKRLAYGRRTIVFAVNVTHSRHLCEAFKAAGVSSSHVDGTMPGKVTEQIYQQLADGDIKVLCSCMKLTEGFDVPSVSAVLLCRPTQSKALHFQMVGRGLRLSSETDKIDCVVLDPAGNIQRHGFIEDLKEISLDPRQEAQGNEAPKKVCPTEDSGCGALLYAFQTECPHCKYIFPKPKKFYLVPELQQQLSESDFERYELYRHHLRSAYKSNFAPGWAAMVIKDKYGHWPPEAWARGAIFGDNSTSAQQTSYHHYLQAIAQRKEKSQAWVEHYMCLEFGS